MGAYTIKTKLNIGERALACLSGSWRTVEVIDIRICISKDDKRISYKCLVLEAGLTVTLASNKLRGVPKQTT